MISGYILAGGLSRRMGRNKALLSLDGKTFIERSHEAVAAIATNVWLVGYTGPEDPRLPIIPDISDTVEKRGSIVGLVSALRHCPDEMAAVAACDLPFISAALMTRIADIANADKWAECVVPIQPDGEAQPLCAIYRKDKMLPIAEAALHDGAWRLRQLIENAEARLVRFSEIEDLPGSSNFFFNVNDASEFEKARRISNSDEA